MADLLTYIYQFAALPSPITFLILLSSAGVAAAVGKLAKDQKHLDTAEETGCDFIPLVV